MEVPLHVGHLGNWPACPILNPGRQCKHQGPRTEIVITRHTLVTVEVDEQAMQARRVSWRSVSSSSWAGSRALWTPAVHGSRSRRREQAPSSRRSTSEWGWPSPWGWLAAAGRRTAASRTSSERVSSATQSPSCARPPSAPVHCTTLSTVSTSHLQLQQLHYTVS